MANDMDEKASNGDNQSDSPTKRSKKGSKKSSKALRIGTLVGIAVLIVFAGLNLYETHQQRIDLNDRLTLLTAAISARPASAAPERVAGLDPDKVYSVKTEGAPVLGSKSAPVTVVIFSDFQCPYCSKVEPTLKQIQDVYKDKVKMVWKNLPLTGIHPFAMGAAMAAEAANKQGKFWEFHDKLFANQDKLSPDDLKQYAKDLGLDTDKFVTDSTSSETKNRVSADISEVNDLGVTGTPGFFINGRFISGAKEFDAFAKVINAELLRVNAPIPPAAVK